jgi:conjugal transfer pilus assembly protein TraE
MTKSKNAMAKSWSQAMVNHNISKVTNVGLIAVILMLSLKILQDPVEVHVNPSTLNEQISIKGNEANSSYKQMWAYAMAELIGNITPHNVGFVKDSITRVLSPRLQAKLEKQIDDMVSLVKAKNVSQLFIVQNMYHNENNDVIYIWGDKKSFVSGEQASSTKWTYEFKISVHNGSPRIVHIDQYKGSPAKRIKEEKEVGQEFLSSEMKNALEIPLTDQEKIDNNRAQQENKLEQYKKQKEALK